MIKLVKCIRIVMKIVIIFKTIKFKTYEHEK